MEIEAHEKHVFANDTWKKDYVHMQMRRFIQLFIY